MTTILYEHPLNERIRHYLKLEQLFKQVESCPASDILTCHQVFFNSLFSIIDVLDRSDIRGELVKDLEKLQQNLVVWSQAPDIDTTALEFNLKTSVALVSQLRIGSQAWCQLKEDVLLASLRQRFAIKGGSCSFDLPQLNFWLHQPEAIINKSITQWSSLLNNIKGALVLILRFIRQRASFKCIETESGFYQDNGEGLLLLRIKLAQDAQYFPTISGNRFRYSIRFMLPCEQNGRRYSNQATKFELARC
jgi:cell division protein ZapD